jgi:hypothetical protein
VHFNVFAAGAIFAIDATELKIAQNVARANAVRNGEALERHSGRGNQNGFHVGFSVNLS